VRIESRIALAAAVVAVASVVPVDAFADALDELAAAVARFRGVGYADVTSYRALVRLPDDPDGEAVPLREIWRAPADLALRAAEPGTPTAVVRGLAIYLEPLYVARASLLGADLESDLERMRRTCRVEAREGKQTTVEVEFPAVPDEGLSRELRDLARLTAVIDSHGRLEKLDVTTHEGDGVSMECAYGSGDPAPPQPSRVVWSLPDGERVEIRTSYRREMGRVLPARRDVVFPSRYDPGQTEELSVSYEDWELGVDIPDEVFRAPDSFRYDENGLVTR